MATKKKSPKKSSAFVTLDPDTEKAFAKYMTREDERKRGTAAHKLMRFALKANGLLA